MLDILYEDNHIIAVNKQSGDIVQGDETGDTPLSDIVKAYIKKKYAKPGEVFLGVVHRLDRPVSGVVLFARTSKALTRLNELFKTKDIQKTYWAVVKGIPKINGIEQRAGTLIHYHQKNEKQRKARLFDKEVAHTKKCILHYKVVDSSTQYHLLEIQLETPLIGDIKYGYERPNENSRSIHLHAQKIEFMHPTKNEKIEIIVALPNEKIWNLFAAKL